MTLHSPALERARSRRPVTWLTLVGVLLLPVLIGGILVAALYNPVERLDAMNAAIVNDDEAVTVDGQLVPLGRQLTGGLVEGSDEFESNLTWTISNADDARDGLADGTYAAVITIPENFSAAALSTRPGETPERATIQVETPPDSLIVDDAITAQVASAAASVMGTQLSSVYLENVFLGFTTLGDELGTAAEGAAGLADGAGGAAHGATTLAEGFPRLSDGTAGLASGGYALQSGLGRLATGADDAAAGARGLQSGLGQLADGARGAADGATQLAAGVNAGADQLEAAGIVPGALRDAADGAAAASSGVYGLAQQCAAKSADAQWCEQLVALAETSANAAAGTAAGLDALAQQAPAELAGQLREIAANVDGLAGGVEQIAGGVEQSAAGAGSLAGGVSQLADGARQSSSGAGALASGASQLTDGLGQAGAGATSLADGVRQLADGSGELAEGLAAAVDAVPTYTDDEASSLASVVANPVETEGVGTSLFGASAVPLLAMLALWFGGLGTFIALQAVSRRALTAREPSALLALRGFAPAAGIGAAQGLLVAGVVQLAASYSWSQWWAFAGIAIVAGVAFAAVNQALVAVFGGAGRWASALIGVIAVATGVVSTVPGVLSGVAGLLPTSPAYQGMVAALTSASGLGGGVAGLVVWTLLAFGATMIAVAARRTTTARALLKASPAAV